MRLASVPLVVVEKGTVSPRESVTVIWMERGVLPELDERLDSIREAAASRRSSAACWSSVFPEADASVSEEGLQGEKGEVDFMS